MNKKTGVLFLVLILPVFVYLGLKTFGTNHFSLPRYVPAIDSTTGEIKMAKRLNPRWNEAETDTVFQTIPTFSLTDETGKQFDSNRLKGKIYSQLSRVQDTFHQDPEVQLLSISVDPKFDQPEKLAAYAKRFDANRGQWYFLTGEKKVIYPLVLKGFHVPLADASEYDAAIKNPDETFIHSERLVLVDKEGVIRGFYDGTDKKDVDRLLVEIKVLKSIYTNE